MCNILQGCGHSVWDTAVVGEIALSVVGISVAAFYPILGEGGKRSIPKVLYLLIYLLTAIGLSPGGSSTVQIYT